MQQKKSVLIVEDEAVVAEFISEVLFERGYTILGVCDNGAAALEAVRTGRPDLILMDIEIKGPLDGIQTARQIAREHPTPLIFLTAYRDDSTILEAVDQRPYAYLIKPVTEAELVAAVALAFKHSPKTVTVETTPACPYRFCRDTLTLFRGEEPVALSRQERCMAGLLFSRPGQLVTIEQTRQTCWPDEEPAHGSLRNLVFKLRRKLPDVTIETLKDTGYRVVPQRL